MFLDDIKARRSCYNISNQSSISDQKIEEIVKQALLHVPSAYNAHMARAVLLLGEHNQKHWKIVEDALRKIVPEEKFESTQLRLDSFASGYGTVLFFNDEAIVKELQKNLPDFADSFPVYAEHGTGMVQFAVWTMLKEAGMGASLQHYGNLVQEQVIKQWNLPENYTLIAQMPFGIITKEPGTKEFPPVETLFEVFK